MWLGTRWLPALLLVISVGTATAAEPPVQLSDDGAVILYRAQPGDLPGTIAGRFGIGAADLPAFLAANGITDPTRVSAGHVYRIANPLAARAAAAETRASALASDAEAARTDAQNLAAQVTTLTARADTLEERSAHLERLARLWPWMQLLGTVLLLALAATGYVAYQAASRTRDAETYASALTDQLDERRRGALAERQASARRILSLEEHVQSLERELAPLRAVHRRPTGTH
jgi:hypothetical protein